jgi:hypothetical protein
MACAPLRAAARLRVAAPAPVRRLPCRRAPPLLPLPHRVHRRAASATADMETPSLVRHAVRVRTRVRTVAL